MGKLGMDILGRGLLGFWGSHVCLGGGVVDCVGGLGRWAAEGVAPLQVVRVCKEGRCGGTWDLGKSDAAEESLLCSPRALQLCGFESSGTSPQLVGTLPSFLMHSLICSSPQVASFIHWHKIFPRQKREGSFLNVG
jgi:hypothetical protein